MYVAMNHLPVAPGCKAAFEEQVGARARLVELASGQRRQSCALFTRACGEDPIGMATPYDRWLLIEVPPPWPYDLWQSGRAPASVREVVRIAQECGLKVRVLAIAPDAEYSRPDRARVIDLRRPAGPFAVFERREFVVPVARVDELIGALFVHPAPGGASGGSNDLPSLARGDLASFERYRQDAGHVRDLLVCTHGSVDPCCARFGVPLYQTLRRDYAAASGGRLRVWRVSHFGGHRFAPTILDLPEGRSWAHVGPELLDCLVWRRGTPAALRGHYRGWSGVGFFGQMVEREALVREGWPWIDYLKQGTLLTVDETPWPRGRPEPAPMFAEQAPQRAVMRLEYAAPDRTAAGAYTAVIEHQGRVVGQGECGAAPWKRNTYAVTRLWKEPRP